MNRRDVIAKGSASAFALTLAGLAANHAVNAQSATPVTGSSTTDNGNGTGGTTTSSEEMAGQYYQKFVAALASNLNSDATTVDTAIRTTLKGLVDDELAAGDIAANDATALKSDIDAAVAPLFTGGWGMHRGGMGMGGRGGMDGDWRGGRPGQNDSKTDDDQDDDDSSTSPSSTATPTTSA